MEGLPGHFAPEPEALSCHQDPSLHRTCCTSTVCCSPWCVCSPSGLVSSVEHSGLVGKDPLLPHILLEAPSWSLANMCPRACLVRLRVPLLTFPIHPPPSAGLVIHPPSHHCSPLCHQLSAWEPCSQSPPLAPRPPPGVHQVQSQHLPGLHPVGAWLCLVPAAGKSFTPGWASPPSHVPGQTSFPCL